MALPLLPIPGIPLPKQQQSFPSTIRRRATTVTAELQTAVARTGGIDYQFPSVGAPTHKVTVHDRQRGIVHEFVVPEVPSFTFYLFPRCDNLLLFHSLLQLRAINISSYSLFLSLLNIDFCFCDSTERN